MPTIANVIPFPPQPAPSRSSAAIAAAILEAGGGPQDVPSLAAGFRRAAEFEQDVWAAMAVLEGASSLSAYLASAGCAAIWAASGPS